MRVVTEEMAARAGGQDREQFFLSHRLRSSWGCGRGEEEEVARGGLHRHMAATESYVALYGEDVVEPGSSRGGAGEMQIWASGDETLKLFPLGHGKKHAVNLPFNKSDSEPVLEIVAIFALDNFVVLMKRNDNKTGTGFNVADMMIVSTEEKRFLFTKEKIFNLIDFMRNHMLDTTKHKNMIASFRQKTITLHQVTTEDVVVTTLDVEVDISVLSRGLLQYCKFAAWSHTYLAHPFQAMASNPGDHDVEVEHRVLCWRIGSWQRKEFKVKGRVNEIHLCLAIHQNTLMAAQRSILRTWNIETGELLKQSQLTPPIPILHSFPNTFLVTDGIGLHIQPQLELLVGVVTGHVENRAIYTVVVLDFDWHLVASVNVPLDKDLGQLELFLRGPRLVLLYNDNSYSTLDLETLGKDNHGLHSDGSQPLTARPFPLGSAHKSGRMVSHSTMALSSRQESVAAYIQSVSAYTFRLHENLSQFNIVICHLDDGVERVDAFNFV